MHDCQHRSKNDSTSGADIQTNGCGTDSAKLGKRAKNAPSQKSLDAAKTHTSDPTHPQVQQDRIYRRADKRSTRYEETTRNGAVRQDVLSFKVESARNEKSHGEGEGERTPQYAGGEGAVLPRTANFNDNERSEQRRQERVSTEAGATHPPLGGKGGVHVEEAEAGDCSFLGDATNEEALSADIAITEHSQSPALWTSVFYGATCSVDRAITMIDASGAIDEFSKLKDCSSTPGPRPEFTIPGVYHSTIEAELGISSEDSRGLVVKRSEADEPRCDRDVFAGTGEEKAARHTPGNERDLSACGSGGVEKRPASTRTYGKSEHNDIFDGVGERWTPPVDMASPDPATETTKEGILDTVGVAGVTVQKATLGPRELGQRKTRAVNALQAPEFMDSLKCIPAMVGAERISVCSESPRAGPTTNICADAEGDDEGYECDGFDNQKNVRFSDERLWTVHEVRASFEQHEVGQLFYTAAELDRMMEEVEDEEQLQAATSRHFDGDDDIGTTKKDPEAIDVDTLSERDDISIECQSYDETDSIDNF